MSNENLSDIAGEFRQYIDWSKDEGVQFTNRPLPKKFAAIVKHLHENIEPIDRIGGRIVVDVLDKLADGEYSDPDSAHDQISGNYEVDDEFLVEFEKDLEQNDKAFLNEFTDRGDPIEDRVKYCLHLKFDTIARELCKNLDHNLETKKNSQTNHE